MALTNKPKKSKYQVGETSYILNGKNISSGLITRIVTSITNPVSDSSGVQENLYYVEGFSQAFKEEEVFHSKNAVLFYVKGDYLNKWGSITFYNTSIDSNSNFLIQILQGLNGLLLML